MLAANAILKAGSSYQERQLISHIQKIRKQHDNMRLQWAQLRLEASTLTDERVVYQIAEKNLGMGLPIAQAVVYNKP